MEKMDKEVTRKIEDFRKNVTQVGEEIVFCSFPTKILELTELIETTNSPKSPFHSSNIIHSTDTTVYPPPSVDELHHKKRKLDNGVANCDSLTAANDTQYARLSCRVAANKHLVESVNGTIKKEAEELATLVDKVKLWVTLTLPKIEDGDNFGVQIQEEVLSELHRAQETAFNIRDSIRQDHTARAKLCSKLVKYPNIEDYKLALREHDDRQFYFANQHLRDLRNVYAVTTDLIHKNISKIRAPKANNSIGLY